MNKRQKITAPRAREPERSRAFIWENNKRIDIGLSGGTGTSCSGRQRPRTKDMQLLTKVLL